MEMRGSATARACCMLHYRKSGPHNSVLHNSALQISALQNVEKTYEDWHQQLSY